MKTIKLLLVLSSCLVLLIPVSGYALTSYCSQINGVKVCQYQDDQYRSRGTTYEYDQGAPTPGSNLYDNSNDQDNY
jgi:hypothetical protein